MATKIKTNIMRKNLFWGPMISFIIIGLACIASSPADASYMPFNTNVSMNVGIGTASPEANLTVAGTARMKKETYIGPAVTSGATIPDPYTDGNGGLFVTRTIADNTSAPVFTVSSNNQGVGSGAGFELANMFAKAVILMENTAAFSSALRLQTSHDGGGVAAYSDVMDLTSAGNVGIGSTSPAGALDVGSGSICLGHTCNSTWPSSGSNYWSLTAGAGNVGISTTNTVGIGTTAGVGAGLVVMNGNVGIGTWVPHTLLSVATTQTPLFAGTGDVYVGNNLEVDGTAYLAMTNGNVGIGTTAASHSFQVGRSVIYADASSHVVGIGDISGGKGDDYILTDDGSDDIQINDYNGQIQLGDINGNGNSTNLVIDDPNSQITANGFASFQDALESIGETHLYQGTYFDPISGTLAAVKISQNAGQSFPSAPFTAGINGVAVSNFNTYGGYFNNVSTVSGTGKNYGLYVIGNNNYFSGNIGIGTLAPNSALQVIGNVGIGSVAPSGALDVGSGSICLGHTCNSTWPSGGSNYWSLTAGAGNVGISTTNTVGIGTTAGVGAGLVVMNGNVGIGTWVPAETFQVGKFRSSSSGFEVDSNGNVGIGTILTNSSALTVMSGNVGIGTAVPQFNLDVASSIGSSSSSLNIMAGSPTNNPVLDNNIILTANGIDGTASLTLNPGSETVLVDQNGGTISMDGAISIVGSAGGFVSTNDNILDDESGNMLISGNIGIGSVAPSGALDVGSGKICLGHICDSSWPLSGSNYWSLTAGAGNVGISTTSTVGIGTTLGVGAGLVVMNGNVGIGTWVPAVKLEVVAPLLGVTQSDTAGLSLTNPTAATTSLQQFSPPIRFRGYAYDSFDAVSQSVDFRMYALTQKGVAGGFGYLSFESAISGGGYLTSMVIASNGSVGIGTSSAVNKLTVYGAAGIGTGAYASTSAPTDGLIVQGNVGIATWTAGSALQVVGNVGIGSVAPSGALDVGSGSICLGHTCNSTWPSGGSNYWSLTAGAGNVGISTTNTVGIGTTSAGAGTGLVVMNGNVGIGSLAPIGGLEVVNATQTGNNFGNMFSTVYGTSTGPGLKGRGARGTSTSPTASQKDDYLIFFGGNGYNGTTFTSNSTAYISINAGENFTSGANGGYIGFFTTPLGNPAGAGERMRIDPAGNLAVGTTAPSALLEVGAQKFDVLSSGKVGIGTTSPVGTFVVRNPSETVSMEDVHIPNGSPFAMRFFNDTFNTSTSVFSVFPNTDGNMFMGTDNNNSLSFYTNGFANPRVFIIGNGNVGIGTSNPFSKLDVVGNIGIGTGINSSYVTTAPPLGGMIVQGNVGIGSLAPGVALDVQGTVRATAFIGDGSGLTGLSGSISGLTANYVTRAASATTITNSIVYDTGTNVGIGVTTPNQTLEVNGGMQIDGAGDSYFSAGNLGLGTTTPQAGLAVMNGNVGIGTWTASSGLQLKLSFAVYRTATASSVSSAGQTIIGVTDTSSARTITLANGDVAVGRVIIIKDESGGAATNHITLTTQGGQTIDGASSIVITANYGAIRVYSDGNNWFTF